MTRTTVHTVESAPEGSRDGLKALTEKYGQTLNIFGAMAESPAVLNAFLAFEGAVADNSSFDPKTREAIHLAVANANECSYCQGAYTMGAKAAGWTEEETVQIRRGEVEGDARTTAIIRLAREIALNKGYAEETWDPAGEAGLSDRERLDVFADTARTIFTNYFNHLVHTDQDVPEAPAL